MASVTVRQAVEAGALSWLSAQGLLGNSPKAGALLCYFLLVKYHIAAN